MDPLMRLVVFASAWVLVGLVTAVVMRRRGHDLGVWAVLGTVFGPFSIPLAAEQVRRAIGVPARRIEPGRPGGGSVDVVVGIDGSSTACAAAAAVVERFGGALGRLTLAAVMDADSAVASGAPDTAELWGEDLRAEGTCRERLEQAADRVAGIEPEMVLLGGDPATVLVRFAQDNGYDFLVVGARGRGASKALLGSVARRLASGCPLPLIIGPHQAVEEPEVEPTAETTVAR
ncbi:MAG: universal stress protein [Nitriliruptorales bacterium]|nr:universal stress protein [Nitriliruptorales bacterium]